MATLSSSLWFSPLPLPSPHPPHPPSLAFLPRLPSKSPRRIRTLRTVVLASSAASFDDLSSKNENPRSKKSVLLNVIQEIEPLDASLIQKDVPLMTIDAMKRTISGMLGLLPSDQFQVSIEAVWEPLSKLLVSSMMTGYTLRNAEYRLCLERNLDIYEGGTETLKAEDSKPEGPTMLLDDKRRVELSRKDEKSENIGVEGLGEITPAAQQYIWNLQSHLSSVKKELHEVKRKSAALQMQQFVGEEKNDLLDYLRSLEPEKVSIPVDHSEAVLCPSINCCCSAIKIGNNLSFNGSSILLRSDLCSVGKPIEDLISTMLWRYCCSIDVVAELSEPTCPELKEAIHSMVHGLLATLSPKMHSKAPPSENFSTGIGNIGTDEDCIDLVENASLQYQPLISLTRDYLARLLFWCMLLGHYLRGLEYRVELTGLLSLPSNVENSEASERI
ncbi:hypothetical protein RHGRI_032597 [Rhododendron griersonianum]|uniref:MAR-binding filament-like protein 1 n=1 Tax=Rhododendron griersonianum TaxID=479676 RepID=A0AAV6II70_9ERIC|nr:hypothetical protein RHGRI_032597 [Rhododendron griersonianum]